MSTATHFLAAFGCAASSVDPDLLSREVPPVPEAHVGIRWLGAAGFEIATASSGTLLVDPYLTRAPLLALLFGRLEPDRDALAKLDADLIVIGHSHFDHLLDAPAISARTGAAIVASADACRVAKSLEPKSSCVVASPSVRLHRHGFDLTPIHAAHGETLLGVPIDGTNDRPIGPTPHMLDMRTGPAFIWVIRTNGLTIVHASTAGLPYDAMVLKKLVPEGADVLLMALALREYSPGYTRHLIEMLRPEVIIPHHVGLETDTLTDPLPADVQEAFAAFAREEGPRVRIPRPFERMMFSTSPTPK